MNLVGKVGVHNTAVNMHASGPSFTGLSLDMPNLDAAEINRLHCSKQSTQA